MSVRDVLKQFLAFLETASFLVPLVTVAIAAAHWAFLGPFLSSGFAAVRGTGLGLILLFWAIGPIAVGYERFDVWRNRGFRWARPRVRSLLSWDVPAVIFGLALVAATVYDGGVRWSSVGSSSRWFYFAWGCLAWAGFLLIAIWTLRRRHRRLHKTCPDCLQTVDSQARACRYCGYRWQPVPPGIGFS